MSGSVATISEMKVFSYAVILVGGYCYELRLNELERLDAAAAAATTERGVISCDVISCRCAHRDVKTRLILVH